MEPYAEKAATHTETVGCGGIVTYGRWIPLTGAKQEHEDIEDGQPPWRQSIDAFFEEVWAAS